MCKLFEILVELHPEVDFAGHSRLIDDGVIDSFDIITLVAEINDRLDIVIGPEDLVPENFNSYSQLLALVNRLQRDQ